MEEIARIVKCSVDTLERRFADVIKNGQSEGKSSLRREQYQQAMKGNTALLIWLGKIYLGQQEPQRPVEPLPAVSERPYQALPPDALMEALKVLKQAKPVQAIEVECHPDSKTTAD